jgi:hypothetical protein
MTYAAQNLGKAESSKATLVSADLARMAAAYGFKPAAQSFMKKSEELRSKGDAFSKKSAEAECLALEEALAMPDWKEHQQSFILAGENAAIQAQTLSYARIQVAGDRLDLKQMADAIQQDRLTHGASALVIVLSNLMSKRDADGFGKVLGLVEKGSLSKFENWSVRALLLEGGVKEVHTQVLEKLTGADRQAAAEYLLEGAAKGGYADIAVKLFTELPKERQPRGQAWVALAHARSGNSEEAKKWAIRAEVNSLEQSASAPYVDWTLLCGEIFYDVPAAEKRLRRMKPGVPRDFAGAALALKFIDSKDAAGLKRVLDLDQAACSAVAFQTLKGGFFRP